MTTKSFEEFQREHPIAAAKFTSFLEAFSIDEQKVLTRAMLEATENYEIQQGAVVRFVKETLFNKELRPKEIVAALPQHPEAEVRDGIWKLLSTGVAEITNDRKIRLRDDRTPEVRAWDEAANIAYGNHRREDRDFGDDIFVHVKNCDTCWAEAKDHAKKCKDGSLLVAKIKSYPSAVPPIPSNVAPTSSSDPHQGEPCPAPFPGGCCW